MNWSPLQEKALSAVSEWLRSGNSPIFYLAGYAGTGKTTLAKHFASGVAGRVCFGSFTGKAAYVLQQKGCSNATTLHSMIYQPKEKSRERLREMQQNLQLAMDELRKENAGASEEEIQLIADRSTAIRTLKLDIKTEQHNLRRPSFVLNPDSILSGAELLVVDECSMVDDRMGEDILSFGTPVLVLGDPAQLPPVRGAGFFTQREPDLLLTEIHRQARDNPIIEMATTVRSGGELELGEYGDSRVIEVSDGTPSTYSDHDQVLCGREKKPEHRPDPIWRRNLNKRIRALMGRTDPCPVKDDKLVCLKNNHDKGLLNGGTWTVIEATEMGEKISLQLRGESNQQLDVEAHAKLFRGEELQFWEAKEAEHFDYGYAMTVHKAQGSQWDSVLVFDQSRIFRENARKWLYTAITRAAQRVTVIRC